MKTNSAIKAPIYDAVNKEKSIALFAFFNTPTAGVLVIPPLTITKLSSFENLITYLQTIYPASIEHNDTTLANKVDTADM